MKTMISSLFLSLAILCSNAYSAEPVTKKIDAAAEVMSRLAVNPSDRICKKDKDCAVVADQCSCSCGVGVAKSKVKKYSALGAEMCKDYKGKMCKILCNGKVKCQDKVCTYVQK